ncbi:MAG: hypothetical protein FWC26_12435 [Fibromonadales bacterium]|nr:hypothetical protein [Fibromonadales bacterium]
MFKKATVFVSFMLALGLFYSEANSQPSVPLEGTFYHTNSGEVILRFYHDGQVEFHDVIKSLIYYGTYETELGTSNGGANFTSSLTMQVQFTQGEGRIGGEVSYDIIPVAFDFRNEVGNMVGNTGDGTVYEAETKAQINTEFGVIELEGQGTYKISVTELRIELLGDFGPVL